MNRALNLFPQLGGAKCQGGKSQVGVPARAERNSARSRSNRTCYVPAPAVKWHCGAAAFCGENSDVMLRLRRGVAHDLTRPHYAHRNAARCIAYLADAAAEEHRDPSRHGMGKRRSINTSAVERPCSDSCRSRTVKKTGMLLAAARHHVHGSYNALRGRHGRARAGLSRKARAADSQIWSTNSKLADLYIKVALCASSHVR